MWVDYHRPRTVAEVKGNSAVKAKLVAWVAARKSGSFSDEFPVAAFLSGPPGVGKTTLAHLCLESAGLDVVEINASLLRTDKMITERLRSVCLRRNLGGNVVGLVLDEVDGAVGVGADNDVDTSAIGALLRFITKECRGLKFVAPVICICNDRRDNGLRALASRCLDLRMYALWQSDMEGLLVHICKKVGINSVGAPERKLMVATAKGDARRLIGLLEMYAVKEDGKVGKFVDSSQKDVFANIFVATQRILASRSYGNILEDSRTLAQMALLFELDAGVMEAMIHSNSLGCARDIDEASRLSDTLSSSDSWHWSTDWDANEYRAVLVPGTVRALSGPSPDAVQFPEMIERASTARKSNTDRKFASWHLGIRTEELQLTQHYFRKDPAAFSHHREDVLEILSGLTNSYSF